MVGQDVDAAGTLGSSCPHRDATFCFKQLLPELQIGQIGSQSDGLTGCSSFVILA